MQSVGLFAETISTVMDNTNGQFQTAQKLLKKLKKHEND